jgi:ABC-type cobalamin/Fe3+-siderophores transport system ATPase subunit
VSHEPPTSSVLEARGLVVDRGARRVLHGIDLRLAPGEGLALVGPNAAGKSTLVRALTGLLPPAGGTVTLKGRPLPAWPREGLARAVALVTAEDEAPPFLTVEERVMLGRYPHRGPLRPFTAEDAEAVDRALRRTGIVALGGRRLDTLSAGERQLALLARGLAQEPEVLLLDEPAAHLDIGHQLQLFRILDEVRRCGVAVLAVVHDLQRAAGWAPRMALLHEGRLVADGPPREVLEGDAASLGFGVTIEAHAWPGSGDVAFRFRERPRPE